MQPLMGPTHRPTGSFSGHVAGAVRRRPQGRRQRGGRGLVKVVVVLSVCALVGAFLVNAARSPDRTQLEQDAAQVLGHTVEVGDFVSVVTESGDIESSSNVEVRCQVQSVGGGPTTILEIVEEGTLVKAGDLLVRFDDTALRLNLTQQEIVVATDRASVIQAQSELEKAQQALKEYEEGTYEAERTQLEGLLFQAELNLRDAENALEHTKGMVKKGYRTQLQLIADQKAVDLARNAVELAKINLDVLNNFTREKMVHQFRADIAMQKAYLTAAEYTEQLSLQRRDELAQQVANCRCLAPAVGQVIYANDYKRRDAVVIEEGAQVREGQVMIRLPDPTDMQVDMRISDSKLTQIEVGDPVQIVLDINPNLDVRGELSEVAPFPEPRSWDGAPIEYAAVVRIIDPPSVLRPGMRAKVHIYVDQQDEVLQVPIQSVVGRSDDHYCLIKDTEQTWSVRQLEIGPNNDRFVVVKHGLSAGDQVALNPELIWDDVADEFTDDVPLEKSLSSPKRNSGTEKPKGGGKGRGNKVTAIVR